MNRTISAPLPGTTIDPRYPDSDGRFMGDTDYHNIAMIDIREGLEDHFADEADVYIASNLIVYYEEGNPSARRDPDVLVAKGVGKHRRRSFRVWEEKTVPRVHFEVASRKTWRQDIDDKRWLYARIRVQEYFIFDPEDKYLDPPLQGFRTVRGKSVPITPEADGSLVSKELGLRLVPDGARLKLIELKTGLPILTRSERAEQEAARANREKARADQLAAENERLKQQLAQRKSSQ